jgi:peroxiredoxin
MTQMQVNMQAPDFELIDTNDQPIRLSNYLEKKWVLLVFNRGFA